MGLVDDLATRNVGLRARVKFVLLAVAGIASVRLGASFDGGASGAWPALEFGLAGAEAEFTRLTQANPEDAAAWYDLGVIRELQGNEELALDAYRRAVGLRDEGVVVTSDN